MRMSADLADFAGMRVGVRMAVIVRVRAPVKMVPTMVMTVMMMLMHMMAAAGERQLRRGEIQHRSAEEAPCLAIKEIETEDHDRSEGGNRCAIAASARCPSTAR